MAYFANVLSSGLEHALQLHEDAHAALVGLDGLGINKAQLPRCWPNYWETVYSRFSSGLFHSIIDLHRELRSRFLGTVVAAADHATQSCSERGATPRRIKLFAFLSHLLAAVSLTSRDEVLGMLSKLNVFIARRAHNIEAALDASLGDAVRSAKPCAGKFFAGHWVSCECYPPQYASISHSSGVPGFGSASFLSRSSLEQCEVRDSAGAGLESWTRSRCQFKATLACMHGNVRRFTAQKVSDTGLPHQRGLVAGVQPRDQKVRPIYNNAVSVPWIYLITRRCVVTAAK